MNAEIKAHNVSNAIFPFNPETDGNGNLFINGNFYGVFGDITYTKAGKIDLEANEQIWENNLMLFIKTLLNKNKIYIFASSETLTYFGSVIQFLINSEIGISRKMVYKFVKPFSCNNDNEYKEKLNALKNMKFDYIIQNPPYSKSLHLNFLEEGLDLLTENGKMVIIEPAMWLINLNPNSAYVKGTKTNHTPKIKEKINGHVESVVIENLNGDFCTENTVPFSITTIDMGKTFDSINYTCCGVRRIVKSLNDCNLIGNYDVVCNIISKIRNNSDVMSNHITSEKKDEGIYYVQLVDMLNSPVGRYFQRPGFCTSDSYYFSHKAGEFSTYYLGSAIHHKWNEITNELPFKAARGTTTNKLKLSNKTANCIYGKKEELENWKYFVYNNKLPIFVNIVMSVDQSNHSKDFLPWIVDKHYTDEEINKMFGFTDEEIELINKTIKKYERNSPWFKRYMCGPDSVSDEEVNNFIESL